MMEETYLMEHIKEAACFVSQDLDKDLAAAKRGDHRCEYVLPDGLSNSRGHLRKPLSREQMREAAKQGKEVSLGFWQLKSSRNLALSSNSKGESRLLCFKHNRTANHPKSLISYQQHERAVILHF